ncbi:lipopolysaccharide assembly protein LapA domain-containing protein [Myxosarcina sp. GI1]|uniref:lipopolysaccharide assembly protein LapA domain-containing protein n=1 Tax=Myxosarcina sp. GI1 TaxID=1541065 RepID=UPI00055F07AC|nr:LapA family protein [Myxosarcina sp. GI1]
MKTFVKLLVSLSFALWLGAIAIFSIQNIQPVSLKFITFESISIPVGVLLAFCVGVGTILGSLMPLLWQRRRRQY